MSKERKIVQNKVTQNGNFDKKFTNPPKIEKPYIRRANLDVYRERKRKMKRPSNK